ncbi:Gag/polymerase/env polyprotein, partial [Globisporangium splendens]
MDSALHFQSQTHDVLSPLIPNNALVWIDDVIVFAQDMDEFLIALRRKLISGEGVRHDPEWINTLTRLPVPSTIVQLQCFVCVSDWLHDSLIDYSRIVAPLQAKLDAEKKRVGRHNRNALQMATSLSAEELNAYFVVIQLIRSSTPLTFPSPERGLRVFTDTSLTGWSIVLTQVEDWNLELPVKLQRHRVVLCKDGNFKGAQLNWANVEKEAFLVVKACSEFEYILQREKDSSCFAITPT